MVHSGFTEAAHDLSVLKETIDLAKKYLKDNKSENIGILADKWYHGIIELGLVSNTPTKNSKKGITIEKERENDLEYGQRIITENFFWRLRVKFERMSRKYRGDSLY